MASIELVPIAHLRDLPDLETERARALDQLQRLNDEHDGEHLGERAQVEFRELTEYIEAADEKADELRARLGVISRFARNPANLERDGGSYRGEQIRTAGPRMEPVDRAAMDGALRAVERNSQTLSSAAGSSLERVIRQEDRFGLTARYIAAIGDPDYESAFAKLLMESGEPVMMLSAREQAALKKVRVSMGERAMAEGTGPTGGYAIPFSLDPSVMLSSNGALNPVRSVARVIQIPTSTWKGVSSEGVIAHYRSEASETSDDSPTLAQPEIAAERGDSFVPFSIEVGQDWASLQPELVRLITDARDILDAEKFLVGSGVNEPAGVLEGLSTSQRVPTDSASTYAVGDPWALKAAIPSRFASRTTFAASPEIWDETFRFVGTNSSEPPQFEGGRGGNFLGRLRIEWTGMETDSTVGGSAIMIGGDFAAGYVIVDRIGMTVEIVQHLFGENRRPTGQRGLFVMWRTGAKVVVPNAFRFLEVATS